MALTSKAKGKSEMSTTTLEAPAPGSEVTEPAKPATIPNSGIVVTKPSTTPTKAVPTPPAKVTSTLPPVKAAPVKTTASVKPTEPVITAKAVREWAAEQNKEFGMRKGCGSRGRVSTTLLVEYLLAHPSQARRQAETAKIEMPKKGGVTEARAQEIAKTIKH